MYLKMYRISLEKAFKERLSTGKGNGMVSTLRTWGHVDSVYHDHALLIKGGKARLVKRQPYQTATQTSCGLSQMDVMLQLLTQDFWLSQVEDLTSQNLHNCGNLTAPLLSVTIMLLLTAEGR